MSEVGRVICLSHQSGIMRCGWIDAGPPVRHATLVGRAHCHPWCGEPKEASPKNSHASFMILVVRCETLPGQDYTAPPAPKCLTRGSFLPNDPSFQDVWWQPLLLSVAYVQVTAVFGRRKLDHQPSQIIALWWWALWSWCRMWRGMSPLISRTSSGILGRSYPRRCKPGQSGPPRGPHHPTHHSWCQRHGINLYWSPGGT